MAQSEAEFREMMRNSKLNLRHGMRYSGTYRSWCKMKRRVKANPLYLAKGIKYSADWEKFENFYRDMGDRPDGLTLERKDNDGDYCKDNCKWATRKEQANNRKQGRVKT